MTDIPLSPTPPSEPQKKGLTAGRRQLLLVLFLTAVSVVFWNSIFIYPVKLFVVFLHEMSHALAALGTGGSVKEIEVFGNEGGLTLTQGGIPFIITSAGYLGSILWGGMLLLATIKPNRGRIIGLFAAAILALATLILVRNTFGFFFGLLFAVALGFACLKLPVRIVQTVVQWLGAVSCLYALADIKNDLLTLQHRQTDAEILAQMTGVPALFWGLLWSAIAIIVFYFIVRAAWKRAALVA